MPAHVNGLPLLRSHERIDYKRCPKKWYWRWRMGLEPKAKTFGALELGTWMHAALAGFYSQPKREGRALEAWFDAISLHAIEEVARLQSVPEHVINQADEMRNLGLAMAGAYDKRYGTDPDVHPIQAEVPLEFEITNSDGTLIAVHKLKPDLVYADSSGDIWIMEHKTAKQIRLEHLVIDDQARPYVAMAELALRKAGLLKRGQQFKGIMYNFLRKALPDERPMDAAGKYLNKNGSVSKQQPTPVFVRHPITLPRAAKAITLRRLRTEAIMITGLAQTLRNKEIDPATIPITPHNSCAKFCQYFTMCVTAEQGGNIRNMQRNMYTREDPYAYEEETSDIPSSFEFG